MNNLLKLAERQNKLGIKFATRGKFHKAIKHFNKAKKIYALSPHTHYFLGLTYQQLKKDSKAAVSYKKAIQLKPDYESAHNNLGVIYLEKHSYKEAEIHLKEALSINPYYAMALNNLGNTYLYQHRLDEAIILYKKALNIDQKLCEAYNNLGVALGNKDRYQEAVRVLKKAIKLKPDYAEAYYHLGEIEENFSKLEAAMDSFEKALFFNSDFTETLNKYSGVLMKTNNWNRLKKILKQIETLTSNELKKNKKTTESPFLNLIRVQDPKINYAVAKSWGDSIKSSAVYNPSFIFSQDSTTKKIKIGYLSFDFNNHAVSHQIFSLFGLHNRKRFEVYTYSLSPSDNSFFRKEIQNHSDRFVDLSNIEDVEAAKKIY